MFVVIVPSACEADNAGTHLKYRWEVATSRAKHGIFMALKAEVGSKHSQLWSTGV